MLYKNIGKNNFLANKKMERKGKTIEY